MIIPASCSDVLRSRPSAGTGNRRSNGFDVNSMKARNPTLTSPMTPSTRATMSSGSWRLNSVTATVHSVSTSVHSSNEPS